MEVQISRCSGSGSRNCGLISFRRNGKQAPRGVCVPACVSECVCQPVIRGFGSGAIYWAVEAKELEGPIENNSFSISKQNPQITCLAGIPFLGFITGTGGYNPGGQYMERSPAVPQCRNISPFMVFSSFTYLPSLSPSTRLCLPTTADAGEPQGWEVLVSCSLDLGGPNVSGSSRGLARSETADMVDR